jgi:cell fate regulator YaaT (PSP1 superfamily)
MENKIELPVDNSMFTHFVGVRFFSANRTYYFGTKDFQVNVGDKVVVETARGLELGEIAFEQKPMSKYTSGLALKPILRIATDIDIKIYEANKKDAGFALDICKTEATKLGLNMNLISCEYTLDKSRVLFSYLADDRVDFRELLKILASKFHTRIELRQVGPRDKAKMVGGIGICGMPLCCSTFLDEFDGISITRAKNQMLAINIPKLSGQCGKLICCLKFEDDAYTALREEYPEVGTKFFMDKKEYTITSVNVISGVVKYENEDEVQFVPFKDLRKQVKFKLKKDKKDHHEKK